MKKFEIKVYHKSTTIDKVWLEVIAESKEDAIKAIEDGDYEWIDSKNVDVFDGEFTEKDEWEILSEEPYPTLHPEDNTEEHD